MNHPAQPAPEGATSALRFTIIALLADEQRGCDHKHLDDLLGRSASLRARCERLEGALKGATDFIRSHAEPFKAGWILRDATLSACDAALAQLEDGK